MGFTFPSKHHYQRGRNRRGNKKDQARRARRSPGQHSFTSRETDKRFTKVQRGPPAAFTGFKGGKRGQYELKSPVTTEGGGDRGGKGG